MNKLFTSLSLTTSCLKSKKTHNALLILVLLSLFGASQTNARADSGGERSIFIDVGVADQQLLRDAITPHNATAFNVFTHGRPGELLVDGQWLDAKQIAHFLSLKLETQQSQFDSVNIYGCEFAKGEKGLKAVAYLENALGLPVNASTNITGAAGDWVLEKGGLKTAISVDDYHHSLADSDGDGFDDLLDDDDDNDGVLDNAECPFEITNVAWRGAGFTDAGLRRVGGQTVSLARATGDSLAPGTMTVEYRSTNPSDSSGLVGSDPDHPFLGIISEPGYTQTMQVTLSRALEGSLMAVYDPDFIDGERIDFSSPGSFESPLPADAIGDDFISTSTINNRVTGADVGVQHQYSPTLWSASNKRTVRFTTRVTANGVSSNSANGFALRLGYRPVCDTDGDNIIDTLDLDSDNDGLSDLAEAGGLVVGSIISTATTYPSGQYPSNAVGGDGVPSAANSGNGYTRGTGANLDSDSDGIPDAIEVQPTTGYLSINESAAAASATGIDQLYIPLDTDADSIPDYLDTNSDADADTDDSETLNTINFSYASTDGGVAPNTLTNGIGDTTEVAYREEQDTDGDGVPDSSDKCANSPDGDDFDSDGVPDGCDIDDDNDGIIDTLECGSPKRKLSLNEIGAGQDQVGATHTEDISYLWDLPIGSIILDVTNFNSSDIGYYAIQSRQPEYTFSGTVPVYMEISHGPVVGLGNYDGISSPETFVFTSDLEPQFVHEVSGSANRVRNNGSNPSDTMNNLGRLVWESVNPANYVKVTTNSGDRSGYTISVKPDYCRDTDGDGHTDAQDLDSDNDGISDLAEAGGLAITSIGSVADTYPDGQYPTNSITSDGISSLANSGTGYTRGTGVNLDSDDDGIPDAIEVQPTSGYRSVDESAAMASSTGADRLYTPEDTDGDGIPDYLDIDSDEDGKLDTDEKGPTVNITNVTYAETDGGYTPSTSLANASGDTSEVAYREAGAAVSGQVYIDANSSTVRESGEAGIGGTVVILRDKTSGICRSVKTKASGEYRFGDVLSGDYEVYQADRETTPVPQSCDNASAKNPVGYQSTTPDLLDVTMTDADTVGHDFGEVAGTKNTGSGIAFEPDHQGEVSPGNTTFYAHTLTSEADGDVIFTTATSGNTASGWTHTLYRDTDCNGTLNGAEGSTVINDTDLSMAAGTRLCIINKVYAPASVPEQDRYKVDITATFTFPNRATGPITPPAVLTVTDLTTAGSGDSHLELTKTVENLTQMTAKTETLNQARPGDTLRYSIEYRNAGSSPITDLKVNDMVPPFTSFVSGSESCDTTPAGMTCIPTLNAGALNWIFTGSLEGGASGNVSYEIKLDD